MIVDLSNIANIDFVVVDALMTLETYKAYRGDNQVRMNTILAGADPVAVDHVSTRLFCLNPDDIAHITLAEKVGLGTNNPEQIKVEGQTIEELRKKVKINTSTDGKFGQSIRTWLLSQAFEGTDVEQAYLPNEAYLHPGPGRDGWSEAIYFYDDRIDLYSYYEGQSNIVSYAFTYFDAPKDQVAELWLGTHEGMEVFLNGEMVHSYYGTNFAFDDAFRGGKVSNINLRQGENTLMVKTLQKIGDYSFTLNICEPESDFVQKGNRVEGLKFYTNSINVGTDDDAWSESEKGMLSVWPNPASDFVHLAIDFGSGGDAVADIYSLDGRNIASLRSSASDILTWNLEDAKGNRVPDGIYLCTVRRGDAVRSARVLVKH
jgi:hypothetical protein